MTPVCSLSTAALKYDALLPVRTAVCFSSSGNLMSWPLIQVGRSIGDRDEDHAQDYEYDSDDAAHGPS